MAQLALFGYYPVDSLVHRMESHFKILLLPLLSTAVGLSSWPFAAAGCSLLLLMFFFSSVPVKALLPGLRFLVYISLFLFGSVFITPKPWSELMIQRCIELLRLAFYLLMGILFTSTTSSGDVRDGLARLFAFLPRKVRINVILLLTFVFAFLPLLFRSFREVQDAVVLRGTGKLRNPVSRLVKSLVPFLSRILIKADRMADAYTLRCLSDRYRPPKGRWNGIGAFSAAAVLAVLALTETLWLAPFRSALESLL